MFMFFFESRLEYFAIDKLFEMKNVFIPFENNINIFVGENGMGKTTILNALYYTLSCQFHKLDSIEFETIRIKLKDQEEIQIRKQDLFSLRRNALNSLDFFRELLSPKEFDQFYSTILSYKINSPGDRTNLLNNLFTSIFSPKVRRRFPSSVIGQNLERLIDIDRDILLKFREPDLAKVINN